MARVKGTRIIRMIKEPDGSRRVHMMIRSDRGTYTGEMELREGFDVGAALQEYLEECAFQEIKPHNRGIVTQAELDLAGVTVKPR